MSIQILPRRRASSAIATVAALVGISLVAAACGSDSGDQAAAETIPPTAVDTTAVPVTEPVPVTEVETTEAVPVTEAVTSSCDAITPGVNDYTLEAAGVTYPVRLFVPSAAADGDVLPLVLNWHGLGSDGPQQAGLTAYEALAESEGFLVASPTGPPAAGDTRNSWELIQLDSPDRDDVAFASALIDDVVDRFCGDEQRVYSTGMSNGGLFTSRLVCQLADRIAAAASVAGVTHPDECEPSRPVPYIAFHGTADGVVPFDGTQSTSSLLTDDAPDGAADFFAQVMPDEFDEFAVDAACSTLPGVTSVSDEVTAYSYVGCGDDVEMIFYEVKDGGHTWPGSPFADLLEAGGLGYTTPDINATTDAWEFFKQYTLDS